MSTLVGDVVEVHNSKVPHVVVVVGQRGGELLGLEGVHIRHAGQGVRSLHIIVERVAGPRSENYCKIFFYSRVMRLLLDAHVIGRSYNWMQVISDIIVILLLSSL